MSLSLSLSLVLIPFYNTAALTKALYSVWQGNDVRMGRSNMPLLHEPYFGKETKGSLG